MLELLVARGAASLQRLPLHAVPLQRLSAPAAYVLPAMAELRSQFTYVQRLQITGAAIVVCVALLSASRRFAPGWKRLVFVPPVLLVNLLMPLLFNNYSEMLTRLALGLLASWLGSFKVG